MSDEAANVHIPHELLQHLAKLAHESGSSGLLAALEGIPGVTRFAPTVDVGQPIHNLALELGRLIARQKSAKGEHVFIHGDAIVTLDETTGKVKGLTAGRMCGFVEQFAAFKSSGRSNRLREGLTREDAALVLEQDVFRDALRPLTAVHTVRLPVMRDDGNPELLPAGYDEKTGIFTCDLVPYDTGMTLEAGREWILDVCSELPWNRKDDAPVPEGRVYSPSYVMNRSLAVHVGALVGTFCKAMFAPGTLRPMISYFGNKPGTGKTRLAEMALSHVHDGVTSTTAPKDEEKFEVKLETISRAMKPYVIFDDIGHGLRSNALNTFLTAPKRGGRCYGSNSEFFEVDNVTQVFVTANDLNTSEDLGRRGLVVELFLDVEVRGRKFKRVISPKWLSSPAVRANFLAACWAIVRAWDAGGRGKHWQPMETYEEWTSVIGGMVVAAGFADPLAAPEMDVGGASSEDELRTLLINIATLKDESCVIPRKELVELARKFELWENVVGSEGDPDPDESTNKRIGRQMQRWREQKLVDNRDPARRFQFGHKRKKGGANYPLFFLDEQGKPIPVPKPIKQAELGV